MKQIRYMDTNYSRQKLVKKNRGAQALRALDPSHKVRRGIDHNSPSPWNPTASSSLATPATRRVWIDFRSAECVPPCPGSFSGQQSVFRHVLGRFPISRVCSATSRINF